MATFVQVDRCPICGSGVFVPMVPPSVEAPPIRFTCRCRQVYPERFKVAGQHGYGNRRRSGVAGFRTR